MEQKYRVTKAAIELEPILARFGKERELTMAELIEVNFWALYRVIEPKRQKVIDGMIERGEIK